MFTSKDADEYVDQPYRTSNHATYVATRPACPYITRSVNIRLWTDWMTLAENCCILHLAGTRPTRTIMLPRYTCTHPFRHS
jgi:hypothetical protein